MPPMPPLPPPPRAARPTRPRPLLKAIARLILAAAVAATLFAAAALFNEAALKWLGHDATATVRSLHEHRNAFNTLDRVAHYTYTSPGRPARDDHSRVNWADFTRISMPFIKAGHRPDDMAFPPDARPPLAVRAYALGPLAYSRAAEHQWGMLVWLLPAIILPEAVFVSTVLYVVTVVRPRRQRRLYTDGLAVPGTITHKSTQSGKGGNVRYTVYSLHYAFTPAGATTPVTGHVNVPTAAEHDAVAVGRPVTVLHHPTKPSRNTLYEYGGYRCD
jgi:hypothetical protein